VKEQSPAFQFYPKDWLSEPNLRGAPLAAKGAYIELLSICWMEQTLPAASDELQRLAGATDEEWNACSTLVQRMFNEVPGDAERLFHKRLDDERERHRARRESASKAGVASGESRRKSRAANASHPRERAFNGRSTESNPSSSSPSSSPTPKVPELMRVPRKTKRSPYSEDFESFWEAYAKFRGKKKAGKAWEKIKPDADLVALIVQRAKAYAGSIVDKTYQKDPATWLNGECWEDEVVARPRASGNRQTEMGDFSEFGDNPVMDYPEP